MDLDPRAGLALDLRDCLATPTDEDTDHVRRNLDDPPPGLPLAVFALTGLPGLTEHVLDHLLGKLHALRRTRDVHLPVCGTLFISLLGDVDAGSTFLLEILDGLAPSANEHAYQLVGHFQRAGVRVNLASAFFGLLDRIVDELLCLVYRVLESTDVHSSLARFGALCLGLGNLDACSALRRKLLDDLTASPDEHADKFCADCHHDRLRGHCQRSGFCTCSLGAGQGCVRHGPRGGCREAWRRHERQPRSSRYHRQAKRHSGYHRHARHHHQRCSWHARH
mmetsp:Transcript_95302/g.226992  ORF Transcript_95302/g.226992 Transcript_95302/m.226992 type:complete len:279 (+) Transcript_95302:2290-3126(+)